MNKNLKTILKTMLRGSGIISVFLVIAAAIGVVTGLGFGVGLISLSIIFITVTVSLLVGAVYEMVTGKL